MASKDNGKVTLAVLKTDVGYLSEQQEEIKTDIKEIKSLLLDRSGAIAEMRGNVNTLKWIFGTSLSILAIAVTVVAAIK